MISLVRECHVGATIQDLPRARDFDREWHDPTADGVRATCAGVLVVLAVARGLHLDRRQPHYHVGALVDDAASVL